MQLLQSKIPFSQVVPVFFRVFLKGVKWELGFANFWLGKWKFIQNENSGWQMGIGSGTGTPFMTPWVTKTSTKVQVFPPNFEFLPNFTKLHIKEKDTICQP
jgi:hypothetical protein